uniref:Uncharacterized protein n=1 Tax=Spongospora subterranea TaxID=70186 RepID=A0A0H5QKU8_9EUKA|eukprot:CRZ02247.1 hypothetical protein [Spongospora subterranea]
MILSAPNQSTPVDGCFVRNKLVDHFWHCADKIVRARVSVSVNTRWKIVDSDNTMEFGSDLVPKVKPGLVGSTRCVNDYALHKEMHFEDRRPALRPPLKFAILQPRETPHRIHGFKK